MNAPHEDAPGLLTRAAEVLEEKDDLVHEAREGRSRWSATRAVPLAMAAAWIVVFVAPVVAVAADVALAAVGRAPLGTAFQWPNEPMAWLGVALVLALPVAGLLRRLRREDAVEGLRAVLGAIGSLRPGSGGGGASVGLVGGYTPGYAPPVDMVTDASPDFTEEDEPA